MNMKHNKQSLMYCLLATILATGVNQSTVMAANGKSPVKNKERGTANGHKPEMVEVIVSYREMPDAASNANIKGLGGQVKRSYENLPMR